MKEKRRSTVSGWWMVVTTGSPLDYLASIEQAYIEGREIDMRDIHRFFFEKYMEKLRQMQRVISE